MTRSTIGGGRRGCNKICPRFGRGRHEINPTGDIFDQSLGGMISIRGKLADHVGDHVVLFPEGAVLVTSPGKESSYPRPPQSLNDSDMNDLSSRLAFVKRTSGAWSSDAESMKAERIAM